MSEPPLPRPIDTAGIALRSPSRALRESVELLSSMRFSISLLSVICIASVIGTVVKQHEPYANYVNQFGPFWAEVFNHVGLYAVYGVWWFLLILAFLVVSTSLCIARNAPKILVDLRTFKEQVREQALASFHHRGEATVAETPEAARQRIVALLARAGWKTKLQVRTHGTMIAARRGAANKLGYIAAHSAIVLVCLGGLVDGDLIVRAQMLWQGKTPFTGGGLMRDVAPSHRLGPGTPTFRANLFVPEGQRSGTAAINLSSGVVLQELPFDVELKKFIVEYYETGMPKLFASEVVIHDHVTGESTPALVKVNEPAFHRGVAIFQSSFEDGGSSVRLHGVPMAAGARPIDVEGVVGDSAALAGSNGDGAEKLTLEFTGLRVINVENLAGASRGAEGESGTGAVDVRKVDLMRSVGGALADHLGSGVRSHAAKSLHNVGPSVSYKLRDAAGQAREFNNYMLPVELDGQRVFLAGTRDKPDQEMRYLRIPADDQGRIDGWARLRAGLLDAGLRDHAAARYVALAAPPGNPQVASQLEATARRTLALFAGADPAPSTASAAETPRGGLQALSEFIEDSVPKADRPRISDVLLRILNGSLFELLNLTRENAGLTPMPPGETTQAFMTQSVLSLSDSFFYPAPVLFELADFKQVQASVFQVARAPGQKLVYTGAVLLIVGVFAMLYIRERRLWVWIAPAGTDPAAVATAAGTRLSTAMSTTRRMLDADAEFNQLKQAILQGPR